MKLNSIEKTSSPIFTLFLQMITRLMISHSGLNFYSLTLNIIFKNSQAENLTLKIIKNLLALKKARKNHLQSKWWAGLRIMAMIKRHNNGLMHINKTFKRRMIMNRQKRMIQTKRIKLNSNLMAMSFLKELIYTVIRWVNLVRTLKCKTHCSRKRENLARFHKRINISINTLNSNRR